MKEHLLPIQEFFTSQVTRPYEFRREQLIALKKTILQHEKELYAALYADLRKSPEECWVTEVGFVIAEINYTLRHLKKWMRRDSVATNLLNFPSRSFIYKEPLGVVLIIGPWNYPFQLLMTPLVGALAAGNCVVLKPSEVAPATAALMEKIIRQTFSPHYVFYQAGEGATVVPLMMNSFRFDHVFYTGSTQVGRMIYEMAAKQMVPVTLELGGKSPCVVESDANISVAAKRIAMTKFSNVGQMCVAPDYLLVHESIKEKLLLELSRYIQDFFTADPLSSLDYGRVINEKQFNRLIQYLGKGKIVFGGNHDISKLYIQPTLLDEVIMDSDLLSDEVFGPILPVISFATFEEAKKIINRNPDPLAFYVFTKSSAKEKQWIDQVAFGGGCINNASWHLTNIHLPFGGRGNSGMGAYHGKFSFDVFSHHKSILKTPTWFDPKIKYPPFKGKLNLFKKIMR